MTNKTIRRDPKFLVSIAVISIFAIFAVGSTATNVTAQTTTNMTKYSDPLGRFSLSYPSSWTATPATNRFETNAVSIRDGLGSTVLVQTLPHTYPIEQFAHSMQDGMYGYLSFQDVECSKYKVDGNLACSFINTKSGDPSLGTPSITEITIVTAINGKIYSISMGSPSDTFDSMMPTFEKMVNSFTPSTTQIGTGTGTGTEIARSSPNVLH